MPVSVTGSVVGIENKTVSNMTHAKAIMLMGQPRTLPIVHLAPLTSFRRWTSEMAMGIPYDTASEMTPTLTNARNADEEPRFTTPNNIWMAVVRPSAQMGAPWRESTLDQRRSSGIALSRENAQVHRDAATVAEMEQKKVMTRTRKVKPRPPPGESMTLLKM